MKSVLMEKRDGKVSLDTDLEALFSMLRNGRYIISVKRASERRTIAQNDLMWSWFSCIEEETGTAKNDVYMYYCKRFLCKVVSVGERMEKIYQTSSMLNTVQMADFLKKIQADAATELGITLPIPEDRYFEDFYNKFKS
jgi:hypothetical protein|nr:MAG TPA: Putative HNHc nuclease [Caudoviricetes sp.]